MRPGLFLGVLAVFAFVARPARAQLAQSFYNVTAIQTRALPNAVQVTIRTDGAVLFGGDIEEFINTASPRFDPRPVTSLRLRLLRARARLPAFVDIGTYPLDSAVVTLGSDELKRPFLSQGAGRVSPTDPRLDIQLRFFVPVTIRRFVVDRYSGGDSDEEGSIGFGTGAVLGPREASVELGPDRRSIVITVLSDRVDGNKAARIRRSPPEAQKHRLSVTPAAPSVPLGGQSVRLDRLSVFLGTQSEPLSVQSGRFGTQGEGFGEQSERLGVPEPPPQRFRMDALHTPLGQLLDELSAVTGTPLIARGEETAATDVSLLLPDATLAAALRALSLGYGLIVSPRSSNAGSGYEIARGGVTGVTERLPLKNLSPEQARLLFPDFLLPVLQADVENNALIVSGSPELIERLRRDIAKLDVPRAQVRVEVQVIEFATSEDARIALQTTQSAGGQTQSGDSQTGTLSVTIAESEKRRFSANVDALAARGRARIRARPFVVVASGAQGTLFLGQSRFVTVVQNRRGRQTATAVSLPIGYSLTVTPTVGAAGDVTLELNPRVSTVDAVERATGLPTLGIREVNTVTRLSVGDTLVVAGLDSNLDFDTKRPLSRDKSASQTALVLLVTARKA